jgi:hypothetical protein
MCIQYRNQLARIVPAVSVGLIALAGLTGNASGQEYLLSLEGGPGQVDLQSSSMTITLDVIGDIFNSQGDEYMLWGWFGLETSGDAIVEDIQWIPAAWSEFNSDEGYLGQGVHGEIEFGQWHEDGWAPREGSAVGNRIGSFQITLAQQSIGAGQFSAGLIHGERYSLSTINVDTGASYYSTPDSLELQGFTSNIVPSPGSSIFVIGVGMAFGRRRR